MFDVMAFFASDKKFLRFASEGNFIVILFGSAALQRKNFLIYRFSSN